MRDSMVLYRSFAEAMDELPAEQYKETMQAITKYAMDGIEPDCSGVVKAIFLMAKPQIDANNKKYENGKRGGKPRTQKPEPSNNQNETKTKPNETKPEPNVNVNVNVNDNDNVSKEKRNYLGEFETLWLMYPRKQGKSDARRHYVKAAKEGTTFEEVETGIHAYENYIKEAGVDPQYVKMGSSFFCQRAWADDWTVPAQKPRPNNGGPYQPEPPKYPEFEPDPEVDSVQMPDEIRKRLEGLYYE